jgi:hypothetical protein
MARDPGRRQPGGRAASARDERRWPLVSGLPEIGALVSAPGYVRAHLRATLARWNLQALSEAAETVASELVTNAVTALADPGTADAEHPLGLPRLVGGSPAVIAFRMRADETRLLIEVWDPDNRLPVLTEAAEDDESGRGLAIVAMLSETWGCAPNPAGGKITWALLSA